MRTKKMALAVVLTACVMPLAVAQDAGASQAKVTPKQTKSRLTPKQAKEATDLLSLRLSEAKSLRDDAARITKTIGELASSGKLPQDAQGVQTLQQLVDELKGINTRLTAIEQQVDEIQGYIEGQKESLPVLMNDVADLKKTKFSGSIQTQYRDSDLPGQNDGFYMRETRLGLTHQIDSRTSFKLQVEMAGSDFGSTVNEPTQTTVQMRDAYLTYDIEPSDVTYGTMAILGRQSVPLGYDIERSSTEREFPERAQYNQVFFPGERSTGLQFRRGFGANSLLYVGGFNSLTYNDAQQRVVQGPPGNRLALVAGARFFDKHFNGGISGWFGKRASQDDPTVPVTNPTNDRRFVYLDGAYVGLFDPKIVVRGEAMWGHDRLPSEKAKAGNIDRDVQGAQFQVGYKFNSRNELYARYETYDPNTDVSKDRFTGTGLAYLYYINPNARLTIAQERIKDESRSTKKNYGITTIRVQFKF